MPDCDGWEESKAEHEHGGECNSFHRGQELLANAWFLNAALEMQLPDLWLVAFLERLRDGRD